MNMKRKILVAIGVIAGLTLLVLALRPAPVPVSVVTAERARFTEYVEEEGRTSLRDPYTVSTPIGGYLRRVGLEVGDEVGAGDVIFTMDPSPAPALDARAREQARQTAGAARARVEAAEADLEALLAARRFAALEWERSERLFAQRSIAESERDRSRLALERAEAAERAAANTVEAARYELRNALAVLNVADGDASPGESEPLRIRAPLGGVVLTRHRWNEGMVAPGEAVMDLGDLSQLEVTVDLLSMDAVRVEEGMRVELTRWGGEGDLAGTVRRVEPAGFMRISALGVEEQRVPVRIVLNDPREEWAALGKDYRVEARFILWEADDVLQIPTSALFRHGDRWHAYVVKDGRAHRRPVEPGRRSGLWSQIHSGLEAGDQVVTRPGDRVEDGVRIRAEETTYR